MKTNQTLGRLSLEFPMMNAAGTCKTIEDFEKLASLEIGAIVVGSITLKERSGNSGNVYANTPFGALNSIGMTNAGIEKYKKLLPKMELCAKENKKWLGVSVAGFNAEEYISLTRDAFEGRAHFVELNLGCPNVWADGSQHEIATFDSDFVYEVLSGLEREIGKNKNIVLKVSPISNPFYLKELAEVISKFEIVKAVTAINTFPNGLGRDETGNPLISVGKGLAGVSGLPLKLIGQGQVMQWREYLPERIQIIAAGGIDSGKDMMDYMVCGAYFFQIATAYFNEGPGVFSRVQAEALAVSGVSFIV